jgi:hypothetical protein
MNFRHSIILAAIVTATTTALAEDAAPLCPPISLSLKNATLSETTAALTKAGIPVTASAAPDLPQHFTLDLHEKPFWNIFRALSAQAPLQLAETPAGLQLQTADPGWTVFDQSGDMAVIPGELHYHQTISLQPAPPPDANRGRSLLAAAANRPVLALDLTYAFDPRLKATRSIACRVLSVTDDAGNFLLNRQPGNINPNTLPFIAFHYVENSSVVLNIPEHPGTRIAALDGDCIFEYMPDFQRSEISPLDALAGKDFEHNSARIIIDSVTHTGGIVRISGNATGGGILEISGADGRIVNTTSAVLPTNKSFTITALTNAANEPYKATITVGAAKQKTLLFHLTNLPLPLPRE